MRHIQKMRICKIKYNMKKLFQILYINEYEKDKYKNIHIKSKADMILNINKTIFLQFIG